MNIIILYKSIFSNNKCNCKYYYNDNNEVMDSTSDDEQKKRNQKVAVKQAHYCPVGLPLCLRPSEHLHWQQLFASKLNFLYSSWNSDSITRPTLSISTFANDNSYLPDCRLTEKQSADATRRACRSHFSPLWRKNKVHHSHQLLWFFKLNIPRKVKQFHPTPRHLSRNCCRTSIHIEDKAILSFSISFRAFQVI